MSGKTNNDEAIKAYESNLLNSSDENKNDIIIKDLIVNRYLKTWCEVYEEYSSMEWVVGYKNSLSKSKFHDHVMGKSYSSGMTTFKGEHRSGDDCFDSYYAFVKVL
jgi:hypothetical protein